MTEQNNQSVVCSDCDHPKSLHHANEIQTLWDGTQFLRTCFGIACTCGKMFDNYPHKPRTVKKIKKKKHWVIRLIKRQKIKLDIIIKRTKKKLHRKYMKLKRLFTGEKVNLMNEKNQNILIVVIYAIVVSITVSFIPQITTLPAPLVGLLCGLAVIPILIFNWRRRK